MKQLGYVLQTFFCGFFLYFLYLHFKCYLLSQSPPKKKPSLSHHPCPCFYDGVPPPIYPLLTSHPWFPYTEASIKPSQNQGPLLPLMPEKAILCYICSWSHVYSLVSGLVPGSLGGGCWLVGIVVLTMELQTPSVPSVLYLTSRLGTLSSVQWLAVSIRLYL